ncbi:MAG: glycosyltransferase [Bacteroidales bacterium]|nr:glycosyltransferase [Bacteroidales bacterium]
MNIIHVISSISVYSGGPSKNVCVLALEQAKKNHKVMIVTTDDVEPYFKQSPHYNLEIVFVKGSNFKSFLIECVKANKPDILHGHGLWLLHVHKMVKVGLKYSIPYIISPRGMLITSALRFKYYKKLLALWLYQKRDLKRAACIHVTSLYEAQELKKFNFNTPIAVIPNSIEIIPNQEKIKVPIKRIAYVGLFKPIKNLDTLLLAWKKVKNKENWELLLVGQGEKNYIKKLKHLIVSEGISNSVKFIEFTTGSQKNYLMRTIDILVLPSHSENFGVVVAEALQYNIPVIASTGTPWEEINIYNCGWWVNNDVDTLAKTIEKAISLSDEERYEMGKRGRKLIEEKYNIEKITNQMINLYNWVVNKGEKPTFVI